MTNQPKKRKNVNRDDKQMFYLVGISILLVCKRINSKFIRIFVMISELQVPTCNCIKMLLIQMQTICSTNEFLDATIYTVATIALVTMLNINFVDVFESWWWFCCQTIPSQPNSHINIQIHIKQMEIGSKVHDDPSDSLCCQNE